MHIELVQPDTIRLWDDYPALATWRDALAVLRPGYEYMRAFQEGTWDGLDKPGRFGKTDGRWNLTLERGWLERALRDFPDAELTLGYTPIPSNLDPNALPGELRDYQHDGVVQGFHHRWGQMHMATNAGKGAIIALTAKHAAPHPVVILSDDKTVYQALCEQLEEWAPDVPYAKVRAGAKAPPTARVTVAMVPTLHKRLYDSAAGANRKKYTAKEGPWMDWAKSVRFVILDEADLATSGTWRRVVKCFSNSDFRTGFSGSFPDAHTHDGRTLEGLLGPKLPVSVRNKELVERGISAKPLVELYPYRAPEPHDGELRGLTGPERRRLVYRQGIVHNPERHAVIRQILDPNEPNVVLVNLLDHGNILADFLPGAEFLQGSDSDDVRMDTMERFARGDFQTLIATRILDRGTNLIGHAAGVVLASGEGSMRQVLQRIGRGLRRGGGKEFVYLRDVLDHGHAYLNRASQKRVSVYQNEGFDVTMKEWLQ